jgi:DNA-binding response OmpR family regulator
MTPPAAPASCILVIEDDKRIRAMLDKGLRKAGFEPVTAADGTTGLAEATGERILDLIILDLGLPDMDGLEVMQRLRNAGVNIPVVILTARDSVDDKVTALGGGAQDYITKPFSFEELIARVRLRLGETEPAHSRPSPADAVAVLDKPATHSNGPDGAGQRRVLVVEDEERIASFLTKGLARIGLDPVIAEDGEVGAFLATTEPFDVILLDLGLPGVDGFEVLTRLRAEVPWVPVVLLTGQDDPDARRRAHREGAAGFLTKPVVFAHLRDVLGQILGPDNTEPGRG